MVHDFVLDLVDEFMESYCLRDHPMASRFATTLAGVADSYCSCSDMDVMEDRWDKFWTMFRVLHDDDTIRLIRIKNYL